MKSDEALAAEQSLEAKLEGIGLRGLRNPGTPTPEPETEPGDPGAPADTAAPEPEPEEPPAPEPEPEPVAEEGDPVAAAVLAKYGNNPEQLARAHAELQKKLGQQGSELGEERQKNADYEQILNEITALRAEQQQQPRAPFVDQATADYFDQAVMENPAAALEWARQQGNELLYQRGLNTWKEVDPFSAARYANAVDMHALEQRLAQQRPTNDSVELQAALNQVLSTHQEFVQYSDDLPNVINRYPLVAAGLTGSQEQKQQAIETLFALAERDTLRSLALTGATAPTTSTTTSVAVPATTEQIPDEEPQPPSPQDVFREQFRQEAARYSGERAVPGAYVAR